MTLMAGAMCAACGGDDDTNKGGENNGGGSAGYPTDVQIDELISGPVKAGFSDAITVQGSGFSADMDYLMFGYEQDGKIVYKDIPTGGYEMRSTRVVCGLPLDLVSEGLVVKIYLDRIGYDKMPITDELTVKMPDVSEGYIPDPAFRAVLADAKRHPGYAPLFNALGLLDVTAAKTAKSGSTTQFELELAGCSATSFEGIELFEGVSGLVAAWDTPNVKEIDLSKWQARGFEWLCDRANSLEKFVGAPYCRRIKLNDCPKLTHVDVHNCLWLSWLDFSGREQNKFESSVTYADIRKNGTKNHADRPEDDDHYMSVWNNADQGFTVADNALIKIDSWFLMDHTDGAWSQIYNAWKDRGATIEVYSRIDPHRDELLGTVPSYEEDPDALSPNGKKGDYQPSNKWQVDDPYTDGNEAPEPYVPPGQGGGEGPENPDQGGGEGSENPDQGGGEGSENPDQGGGEGSENPDQGGDETPEVPTE